MTVIGESEKAWRNTAQALCDTQVEGGVQTGQVKFRKRRKEASIAKYNGVSRLVGDEF